MHVKHHQAAVVIMVLRGLAGLFLARFSLDITPSTNLTIVLDPVVADLQLICLPGIVKALDRV